MRSLFQLDRSRCDVELQRWQQPPETPVYDDGTGFQISAFREAKQLRIANSSPHSYTIAPYCQELQGAVKEKAGLIPGIYIAKNTSPGTIPDLAVAEDSTIETTLEIPPPHRVRIPKHFRSVCSEKVDRSNL